MGTKDSKRRISAKARPSKHDTVQKTVGVKKCKALSLLPLMSTWPQVVEESVVGCKPASSSSCSSAAADATSAQFAEAAQAFRSELPSLWRNFHGDGERASFRIEDVRNWLANDVTVKAVPRELLNDSWLTQLLEEVSHRPPLQKQMGFRFTDPSDNGGWGVDNLKGFSASELAKSEKRGQRCRTTWHCYVNVHTLRRVGKSEWAVDKRTRSTIDIGAEVEKLRRGPDSKPLAKEKIYITAKTRRANRSVKIFTRKADLLPAIIFHPLEVPEDRPQWTLIYLHGLGSSAFENYEDRPHYFYFDNSISLRVIVPTAPNRELSCYDTWWVSTSTTECGWKMTKFQSWFDYLTDRGGRREDDIDVDSLHAMRRALHSLIDEEAKRLGGRADRIILGGKSQGCCTALDAALTYPRRLGGFIGVVGTLLTCTPVQENGPQQTLPLHFFHEPEDDVMRWSWVQKNEKRLKEKKYNVTSRRMKDPEKHGHFIDGIEGRWIRQALSAIWREGK